MDASDVLRIAVEDTKARQTRAVILAGGRGTRLAPFTSVLPKPLMPVGERAILELVVERLESCGIVDITFCVGYLSHLIRAVFDSRQDDEARISYVLEQRPMGTAGPLRLVEGLDDTFVVMNGDVLTDLDYGELLAYHRSQPNVVTIATYARSVKIDYGVLRFDGDGNGNGNGHVNGQRITGYVEKPEYTSAVSMGIYVFEPSALDYIAQDEPSDFPDLVQALLRAGQPVGAYRHDGMWFDIGRQDDYKEAVEAWLQAPSLQNGGPSRDNGTRTGTTRPTASVSREAGC
ncbi:MAG TPA: sugar phosphate nucleotidyltransferase [Gaiellaceae bacterium]|nr:sugar phosphate nucleotidyltransferase [Gaiellaceae bacterium]